MDNEARKAVLFCNHAELLFPQINRVVVQDMKQGVILDCRERELQDPPDKERHQTTAAAALRLQVRSEEHTSELQSQSNLVCRLLLEKKKKPTYQTPVT